MGDRINILVPPSDEAPEPDDIRANFEMIDGQTGGLYADKTGLAKRPHVNDALGTGSTEGEVGAGNGPDCNFDGGELRGFILAAADTEITANADATLALSNSVQVVNSASAITISIADANFPVGACATYVQVGAGKIVFSATAPLSLVNYSGHTKSGGQYAAVTITRLPSNRVLLTGITSA